MDYGNIFYNKQLIPYESDPDWFKKALVESGIVDDSGHYQHIDSINGKSKKPIITELKYIKTVSYNNKNTSVSSLLDKDLPIVLIREDNHFVEPISNTNIALEENFNGLFFKKKYNDYLHLADNNYLLLSSGDINSTYYPYGILRRDAYKLWKKNTLPLSDEIIKYMDELKKQSKNNFDLYDVVSSDEVSKVFKKT